MVLLRKNQSQKYVELIERIRSGEQKAITELYYELIPHVRKIIFKKVYSITPEDLYILTHEITTEVLLHKLDRYDSSKDFAPYIWRVITNLIADNYRKNRGSILLQKNSIELNENTIPFVDEIHAKEHEYFYQKKLSLIFQFIQDFPIDKKRLILEYYFRDKSINRISRETGRTVPAITSDLHRIRRILQQKMAENGYMTKGKSRLSFKLATGAN